MIQTQTDYNSRNNVPQEQYTPKTAAGQPQPAVMLKRIGSTTYEVSVHFSKTSNEDMNDKILRLIRNEANGKAVGQ